MSVQDFLSRAQRVASEGEAEAANVQDGTRAGLQAAKRAIASTQRELRVVRRDLVNEERQVQSGFKDASAKAAAKNHFAFQMMTGKKSVAGQMRQGEKRRIATQKDKAIAPYRQAKATIDQMLTNIANTKDRIDIALEKLPATSNQRDQRPRSAAKPAQAPPPPAPEQLPPPQVPPGWHVDPTGRHSQRYWDGVAWTPHVVSDGVNRTDPI